MANQLKMADLQSLLALHKAGWSARRIARALNIDRETVGRHLRLASAKPATQAPAGITEGNPGSSPSAAAPDRTAGEGPPPASESKPATQAPTGIPGLGGDCGGVGGAADDPPPASESKPASHAPPGIGPAAPEPVVGSRSRCHRLRAVIEAALDVGLSAQRIYQDLVADHGYEGSYYSVRRLVRKLSRVLPLPVRRMEREAGAEAQVDFGTGAAIVGSDGKRRKTWVFRFVLSHSRKGYSEAVFQQTTAAFLLALENAFYYFGGVPRTLIPDNLAAAVKHADWFDPELNPIMASFGEHFGIAILPTRPGVPRHKGKIERGIGYVKGNALKGRCFATLAEQNKFLLEWESNTADQRIHGTTRKHVGQLFQTAERGALRPLPPERFQMFNESQRIVHRDGHVEVARAYYSVPPEFLGQQVWARWDGRLVRVFDRKMRQIAVHARQEPGGRSTLGEHIATRKINAIERGAAFLIERAGRIGPNAQAWATAVIQARGEAGMRTVMGLHSLRDKYPPARIDHMCGIALSHQATSYRAIRALLERDGPAQEQGLLDFAQDHPIIRPLSDYTQLIQDAFDIAGRQTVAGSTQLAQVRPTPFTTRQE